MRTHRCHTRKVRGSRFGARICGRAGTLNPTSLIHKSNIWESGWTNVPAESELIGVSRQNYANML